MAGLDFPFAEGFNNQRKEYLYKEISHYLPEKANTPELFYGDLELEYMRYVNEGTIPSPSVIDTKLKNLNFVNVMDFGAKGDGVTDDRAAIQAAHNYAGPGGTVYYPDKVFLVASATQPEAGNTGRIIVVYPNQTLIGASRNKTTIKVANNFGGYYAMFGCVTEATDMGQIHVSGIKFDQNNQNGNVYVSAEAATYPRHVFRMLSFNAGSVFDIRNCTFANGDCTNHLYIAGDILNVCNNIFYGTGVPGGATFHDHSSVYTTTTVEGGTQNITDNIFRGNLGSGSAVCAIETHGGTQNINDNNISGYMIGSNITGISNTIRHRGTTFANNQISKCVFGIQLWSQYSGTVTTGDALSDVILDNNHILIDRDSWVGIAGLAATAWGITIEGNSNAPINGLVATGNIIKYLSINAAGIANDANSSGIRLVVGNAACTVSNVKLVNNEIINPISTGMHLSAIFNTLLVAGNVIKNPAQSNDASVSAVYMSAGVISGTMNDAIFVDNQLVDERGVHKCVYMFVCLTAMTAATNFRFMGGNTVRYTDGVTPAIPVAASSTAGCAPFVQEVVQTWPGTPANNYVVGSNIRVASSGNVYMQGTGPTGNAWNLGSFNNLPTTTVAPAAGAGQALPATPAGYVTFYFNGAARQLPYY